MYLPETFAQTSVDAVHALIERNSFGILIVPGAPPDVSHIPFALDRERGERGTLLAHVARANPIWRGFDGGAPVIAVFQGPHGYISPRWYTSRNEVPTWNYAVVHAHGTPRLLASEPLLRLVLEQLTRSNEPTATDAWTIDDLTPEKYADLSQAIVAFEIPIDRIEGKFKLSQNRKPADREGAIRGLLERGTEGDLALARLMTYPDIPEK